MKKINLTNNLIGKFSVFLWTFSFFFISGGLYYSVWLGIGALAVKFLKKEKIVLGYKRIFWALLLIYLGTIVTDLLNIQVNYRKIPSFDKYSHFLMYLVFINFIKGIEDIKLIFKLLIVSLLGSYVGTIQHWKQFTIDPYYRMESFYDIMRFGHMLSAGLTLLLGYILFYKKDKTDIKLILLYLFGLVFLFLNKTRGAMLSAFISQGIMLVYYVYTTKKIKLIITALSVSVLSFVAIPKVQRDILIERFKINGSSSSSNQLRLAFWEASWNGAKDNPLKGVGYRGVRKYFTEFFQKNDRLSWVYESYGDYWGDPHSTYMSMLIRHGFVLGMFFIFLSFLILPQVYISNFKSIDDSNKPFYIISGFVFLNFLLSGFTETTISVKEGNIFILAISLMMVLIKNSKNEEKSE